MCLLLLSAVLAASACSYGSTLANAESSPEQLTVAVLEALERRDEPRLRALALSEQEFRDIVWPELPASRPERNLPFSYVWTDLRVRSEGSLTAVLGQYGGRRFSLLGLRFAGGSTQYDSLVVHRQATLMLLESDGTEHEVRLFGSILEQGGRFKVFSYVVG